MDKVKNYMKKNRIYIAALLMPWIITLVYCAVNGVWITGDGNIASGDMLLSIIPGAYSIWDKFHTGQSFSYTWTLVGGSDFHTVADFLISPFTLVMLLFPRNAVPDFVQFTMIAKWSLSAFSMVYFFHNTRYNTLREGKEIVSLFLGMAFALGNGIVSYLEFINYMEVIILFPFLLLLVEGVTAESGRTDIKWYRKKSLWYYLLLTYCIFANFYTAFQICIFLAFWFFLQLSVEDKGKGRKFISFLIPSVMAGISNLGLLIMEYNLFSQRVNVDDAAYYDQFLSGILVKPAAFISNLFTLQPIVVQNEMIPNIYFSVAAVMVLALFPVVGMSIRKKIYMGAMALFLVASFFLGRLNLIWHLLRLPNGVYNRFMYIFVFYMLFIALLVFDNIDRVKSDSIILSAVIVALGMIIVFLNPASIGNVYGFAVTLLIVSFLFIMLVLFLKKSITQKQLVRVIAVCGLVELCANAIYTFGFHDYNASVYGKNGIADKTANEIQSLEWNKGERLTSLYPVPDLGQIANRNSESGFISAINVENRDLHARLGMAFNGNVIFGMRGGSPLVNLLFNTRYGVGESGVLFSDADKVADVDDLGIYHLNRLAGLGFMVDDSVLNWDSGIDDCFQYQNDFVKKAVGGDEDIFTAVHPDADCFDTFGEVYEANEEYLEEGIYYYLSEIKYGSDYDAKQIDSVIDEDMDLYMYFICPLSFRVHIFIDGEKVHEDLLAYRQSTYHIGQVKKGQKLSIVVIPQSSLDVGQYMDFMFRFAKFNEEAYEEVYEKLCGNVFLVEEEKEDYIKGAIHADSKGIMMTSIPYSPGFSVYVDGEGRNVERIGETMMGVSLEPGDHEVEFRYTTPYIKAKWLVLVSSVILYIILSAVTAGIKRKD